MAAIGRAYLPLSVLDEQFWMDQLEAEIEAFEANPPRPPTAANPIVVFFGGQVEGWFPSFEDAYNWASVRLPSNRYLVRDVSAEPPFLPLLFVRHATN
jgi:hypothetical protein